MEATVDTGDTADMEGSEAIPMGEDSEEVAFLEAQLMVKLSNTRKFSFTKFLHHSQLLPHRNLSEVVSEDFQDRQPMHKLDHQVSVLEDKKITSFANSSNI